MRNNNGNGLGNARQFVNQPIDANGMTPLMDAASQGDLQLVQELIELGANVNAQTRPMNYLEHAQLDDSINLDGQPIVMTPIKYALLNVHEDRRQDGAEIARYLLERGADANEARDFYNLVVRHLRGTAQGEDDMEPYRNTYKPVLQVAYYRQYPERRRQDGGKRYRRKSVKRASKKRSTRRRHRRSV